MVHAHLPVLQFWDGAGVTPLDDRAVHALPVLVLTGGPAAGKTSTARAVAAQLERAAVIDVDDPRHLVVAGHAAPWEGSNGLLQQELGVRHACLLARSLTTEGFAVVVADVLTPATTTMYRELLERVAVVHLAVSPQEAARRAIGREVQLTGEEFEELHRAQAEQVPFADHVVDVTRMSPEEQREAVARAWDQPF
ncbi:hypothetical protein [Phycicoccus sp. Root101]|uniref:phosphotransferase-like protein n=1 Tax=Phycicoccus sp. Root101 TaxID=1736421 RepID=UPI000713E61A|nr:hypothetical protein [Phycicoccus sp. Root101]KQU67647.1 hypothetical protein ASC58_14080 [Phycicoccus sp. Root101]